MTAPTIIHAARAPALEALRANVIVGRARSRLSQEELAQRAGVSRPTISRIERAASPDVGLETIQRIADALGVRVADLFVLDREGSVDGGELARRAAAPADEFIDADSLLDAIVEANGTNDALERYSRAGRPPMGR